MVLTLNIDQIALTTQDWICKVQIVEIGRPRESPDKKCRFQNLILEDEQECQIKAVLYADEIEQYAEMLKLMNTYLISTARVKISQTSHGKPIHKFYWVLDKETVIEHITPSNGVENPLPPPTKLNITTFDRIPHMMLDSAVEIDILAIVLRCSPQKYAGRSNHKCREIIICDNYKNQFLLTLWEDFGEIEGNEIEAKMEKEMDLIVILGRNIGISTFQGLSLQSRYNSTIHIAPNYPQAVELTKWAKENKSMLLSRESNKTSTSSSAPLMVLTPAGQQVVSIEQISSPTSMGLFYLEAEMAISDELQEFCVLECSGCKQKKRTKDRKDFHCPKCNRKTTLLPRCIFQIDLTDGTATVTASISGELGEKLLSMTAEDIFDITCAKRQSLHVNHVHEMLSNKLFQIQLRKSSWGTSNNTQATYSIISYMEKQHTSPTAIDRNSKKIRPLEISEMEVTETTTAAGSSNATPKFEPPTPTKNL
ncbi:replication protein A 70 kDa DNA-binding subunit B-like [Solanum lycopersicum]|uniref:replication protein A 70 kDa DNA-binding subunit B-like n=1 Tax=Solanum lycopersicum TaxID=4081 RepID=UPI0037481602